MKTLRKIFLIGLSALIVLSLAACSAKGGYSWGPRPSYTPDESAGGGDYEGDGDYEGGNTQSPIRKQLTAGEWRDSDDYDFWLSLFVGSEQDGETYDNSSRGVFSGYLSSPRGLDTQSMHAVRVTSDAKPVGGAKVKLYSGGEVIFEAVSDNEGKAFVFGEEADEVEVSSGKYSVRQAIAEDGVTEVALEDYTKTANVVDIVIVVDTTGSMGDEIGFLKKEIDGIVRRLRSLLDADINIGLVFYRDDCDKRSSYLLRSFPLTNVNGDSGLNKVRKNISAQSAGGGGDYPERPDLALETAVNMQFTEGSTRLIYHFLDAPCHDNQKCMGLFSSSVRSAASKGVRIIPVAASGLDELGQYMMRSAALLTGGTYTFLTDDSGIGDHHELPVVGQFVVEYLSDLIVRLTSDYHNGTRTEPVSWEESSSVE